MFVFPSYIRFWFFSSTFQCIFSTSLFLVRGVIGSLNWGVGVVNSLCMPASEICKRLM